MKIPLPHAHILATRWYTTKDGLIGIVAKNIADTEQWRACIGIASGQDEERDEQYVAFWGSCMLPQEAHGFFPELDLHAYKQEERQPS